MNARRVLVTGAEGLVGRAVVSELLDHDVPVTTLSLPEASPLDGVRVVRGNATDADAVRRAIADCEAVIHLAAFPSPADRPAPLTFGNNTLATFTTLWTAAEEGVRRFAVAGSVNATGLLMNPRHPLPARFPIDEQTPSHIADPYSLSKRVDEETLRAVCERFDASGVIFRLPLIVPLDGWEALVDWSRAGIAHGAAEGWGWMDSRDCARAFRMAVDADLEGAHVVQLAARTTLQEEPTEQLIGRYAPDVPREGSFNGHDAPIDSSRAADLIGFTPAFDVPGKRGRR